MSKITDKRQGPISTEEMIQLFSEDLDHHSRETLSRLSDKYDEMREAMQEFVNRYERGEVRSKHTYEKFKRILEQ